MVMSEADMILFIVMQDQLILYFTNYYFSLHSYFTTYPVKNRRKEI